MIQLNENTIVGPMKDLGVNLYIHPEVNSEYVLEEIIPILNRLGVLVESKDSYAESYNTEYMGAC